ncbi:PP2C family protein-serine/threonine phosphatase [Terriglobus sp. TAA 43]|uniref:PP2C family protein-serine/threonine phosphatase n=1 Tax=Terriglobus sp. TAA 43 TaxID=278961 RepID=UPI0006471110|nr:PP2C family protein-serine/threonine phosphatase [Terriglobus sp. TAA 43]
MPLILRPRQQNNVSDPLYATRSTPLSAEVSHFPLYLRILWGITAGLIALAFVPGTLGEQTFFLRWGVLAVALIVTVPYLYRATKHGLLWRLRNKLILTYLLIGLTPVVLFFTLVFLSAYTAAGQFAVHLASQHLQLQLDNMGTSDAGFAFSLARRVEDGATAADLAQGGRDDSRPPASVRRTGSPPQSAGLPAGATSPQSARPPGFRQRSVYLDDQEIELRDFMGNAHSPMRISSWIKQRRGGQLKVFAEDGGVLYMSVVDRVASSNGHMITVIGTMPVTQPLLANVAKGLGVVTLLPGVVEDTASGSVRSNAKQQRLSGGTRPTSVNLFDYQVVFRSRLPVLNWETGDIRPVPLVVTSRPSVLFQQLFGAGLTSSITDAVRFSFIAICMIFAFLEIFAFYVAMRLTRSMTSSVEDLYGATLSIDSGDLSHRIHVQQDDQLADLGRSFNRMAWSLGRLIEEQKEKERMQSELSIAHEVQANLFPHSLSGIPSLQLHGLSRPARTVSGDYYDFLIFHDDPYQPKKVTGMGLALGDISGKGISAALLMSTLHAAVRAYRFASEELFSEEARSVTHQESLECGELFESPARILALLNRHLYRSTQPEKYATLFLSHYDDRSGRLTYSNAGQLPPFVMKPDGSVRALDKGGTVVGLMDGMRYEQETVQLESGDLLIAYSDGVTEPENDFGEFGEDRLLDVVRANRNQPLEVISTEVMAALDAWIGGAEQPDDITLVLARKV